MAIQENGLWVPGADEETQATVAVYRTIPTRLAQHFENFRTLPGIHSALEDLTLAHELADVPLGKSSMVELAPGDGRDAVTFVPNVRHYVGIGPADEELEIARSHFPDAPEDMFRVGYAQTAELPEDTDVVMFVNGVLHVPGRDLEAMNERVRYGLRMGGVFHLITKTEDKDAVHEYPDDFPGTEDMRGRTFYHHSPETLTNAASKAGLVLVHHELIVNDQKDWDWGIFAYSKES